MMSGLPKTKRRLCGASGPFRLRRTSPRSNRVNSINSDGPIAAWTTFSSSAYVSAAATFSRNAFMSGWPTATSNTPITSRNDLEEVTLNRCTTTCFVVIVYLPFVVDRHCRGGHVRCNDIRCRCRIAVTACSRLDERKQVLVDPVLESRAHAVRGALVDFKRRVLDDLRRKQSRIRNRDNLVVIAVKDQCRHIDFLEILRQVRL